MYLITEIQGQKLSQPAGSPEYQYQQGSMGYHTQTNLETRTL
jgi:hypothetical protein